MAFAEWRALLHGYRAKLRQDQRARAWSVSHLLIAAGCEPDKVTVAKLLGEKEREPKPAAAQPSIDEIWRQMRGQTDGK